MLLSHKAVLTKKKTKENFVAILNGIEIFCEYLGLGRNKMAKISSICWKQILSSYYVSVAEKINGSHGLWKKRQGTNIHMDTQDINDILDMEQHPAQDLQQDDGML